MRSGMDEQRTSHHRSEDDSVGGEVTPGRLKRMSQIVRDRTSKAILGESASSDGSELEERAMAKLNLLRDASMIGAGPSTKVRFNAKV